MESFHFRFKLKFSVIYVFSLFFAQCLLAPHLFAAEPVPPKTMDDYRDYYGGVLEGMGLPVLGAQVAWVNYSRLRELYPEQLKNMTNHEIDNWALQFAVVGELQLRLEGIRNSKIPIDHSKSTVNIVRPPGWVRSGVLVAKDKRQVPIGVVDAKGLGYGLSEEGVAIVGRMVQEWNDAKGNPEKENSIRTRGHSDGLATGGEVLAEVTRSLAAQRAFDLAGMGQQVVLPLIVLAMPFNILRDNHEVPAAILIREPQVDRWGKMPVPRAIYSDEAGGYQRMASNTAVDAGGWLFEDPLLASHWGQVSEAPKSNQSIENKSQPDSQTSKPWIWAHETFRDYVASGYDRRFIETHIAEMMSSLDPWFKERRELFRATDEEIRDFKKRMAEFVNGPKFRDMPFREKTEAFNSWYEDQPEFLRLIDYMIAEPNSNHFSGLLARFDRIMRGNPQLSGHFIKVIQSRFEALSFSNPKDLSLDELTKFANLAYLMNPNSNEILISLIGKYLKAQSIAPGDSLSEAMRAVFPRWTNAPAMSAKSNFIIQFKVFATFFDSPKDLYLHSDMFRSQIVDALVGVGLVDHSADLISAFAEDSDPRVRLAAALVANEGPFQSTTELAKKLNRKQIKDADPYVKFLAFQSIRYANFLREVTLQVLEEVFEAGELILREQAENRMAAVVINRPHLLEATEELIRGTQYLILDYVLESKNPKAFDTWQRLALRISDPLYLGHLVQLFFERDLHATRGKIPHLLIQKLKQSPEGAEILASFTAEIESRKMLTEDSWPSKFKEPKAENSKQILCRRIFEIKF